MCCGPEEPPRRLPSCAFYNIHFLGLSQEDAYKSKLLNVKHLTRLYNIVAISELHVSALDAEHLFFRFVPNTIRFYEGGMAYVVQKAWALAHALIPRETTDEWFETGANFEAIVPGAVHCLKWQQSGVQFRVIHFRLDAFSDSGRIEQLKRTIRWMQNGRRRNAVTCPEVNILGGDRNFAPVYQRKIQGIRRITRHGHELYKVWENFLSTFHAVIQEQPEFTHSRTRTMSDGLEHTAYAVLDVVASNITKTDAGQAVAVRVDGIPVATASDHWPIAWSWKPRRTCNTHRSDTVEQRVRRPLPQWLAKDGEFRTHLRLEIDSFLSQHPDLVGGTALEEITTAIYATSTEYMRTHRLQATSTRHKAEVTLRLLHHLETYSSIDLSYAARLVRIYPNLSELFTVDAGELTGDRLTVDAGDLSRLRRHLAHLTSLIAAETSRYSGEIPAAGDDNETPDEPDCARASVDRPDHGLRNHSFNQGVHSLMRDLNPTIRHEIHQLWDEKNKCFVDDGPGMARLILEGGHARQGIANDQPTAGKKFLDDWDADFSRVRLFLFLVEVEEIILSAPAEKAPGPDGVPAEFYKCLAPMIAPYFLQAWHELFEENYPAVGHLGSRKWVVAAKEAGANTLARLRDIEAGNTVRKTLARMTIRVLDEVMSAVLVSGTQEAFHSKGDITKSNILLSTVFEAARSGGESSSLDDVLLLLGLDCTKGYNYLGWKWLSACLERGRAPPQLRNLISHFLGGEAILMFDRDDQGSLRPCHGLPQGCPLSCLLYIIAVDPLLHFLRKLPGVIATSGFVDDWTIACKGPTTLDEVLTTVEEFERASGQRINHGKSSIIPSRRLSVEEAQRCQQTWNSLQISYHARILGIQYGVDVTLEDQYETAMAKFHLQMSRLRDARDHMSLPNRIFAVNVYIVPLFSYINRFFFMPDRLVSIVNQAILRFLTPVLYVRLNMLCHVKYLYGISAELRDLRLVNVASLLETYYGRSANLELVTRALNRRPPMQPAKISNSMTDAWMVAYQFYHTLTMQTVEDTIAAHSSTNTRPPLQRWFYSALLAGDRPACLLYLRTRIIQDTWDAEAFLQGLRHIPRDMPQGHRWSLLKYHFHGHLTSDRLVRAAVLQVVGPCPLCGATDDDTLAHLYYCPTVLEAAALFPPTLHHHFDEHHMFLQDAMDEEKDEGAIRWIAAFFAAVWEVRHTLLRTRVRPPVAQCAHTIFIATIRPWLAGHCSSLERRERRRARARPPLAVRHAYLYRSDGACRTVNSQRRAGWGVAMWAPDNSSQDTPTLTCCGAVPAELCQTNNVAEFFGVLTAFRRAQRVQHTAVVFQVDSMLIARFIQGTWGCHSRHLRPLFELCRHIGRSLTDRGIQWHIEHIYREYNTVADALAERGMVEGAHTAPGW